MAKWAVIVGFPDYEISSSGRIRRWGVEIHPTHNSKGYLVINLDSGRKIHQRLISQLVCAAFVGPRPGSGYGAAHWDGNKINNRYKNLRWATTLENAQDTKRHGNRYKLSTAERVELGKIDWSIADVKELAIQFKVCTRTIRNYRKNLQDKTG